MEEQNGIPVNFSKEDFQKLADAGIDVEEELKNALQESLLEILEEEIEKETDLEKKLMGERIAAQLQQNMAK